MVTRETSKRCASSLTCTRPVASSARRIAWERECSSRDGTADPFLDDGDEKVRRAPAVIGT
jgi:hypothetical protein